MPAEAWLTVGIVVVMVVLLSSTRIAADLLLAAALTLLIVCGAVSPVDGLAGFGNPGLITVAALFIVARGLIDTGAVYVVSARLLGQPQSVAAAQLRLMLPVTAVSAFLNNTPIVAMLVPVVEDWSRRCRLSVSKLMIPLSYAAIFGGTCTLIGTSTNLIVHGMVLTRTDLGAMGFFELALVGVPVAIVGTAFVIGASRWLLPERRPPLRQPDAAREYALEMLVQSDSPLIGQSVEGAGLRNLPGVFLAEIERASTVMPAVAPSEILQGGDRLLFVGAVESVAELLRLRGLVPAPEQLFKLDAPRQERRLVEVVMAESSPIAGKTIRDGRFRSRYDAVVIAVARNGERLRGKLGDITLRSGDTLLLETRPAFIAQQRYSRDFLLVSEVASTVVPRHERAGIAALILITMVAAATTELLSMLEAALLAAGAMIATGCTSAAAARSSINWSLLIVIGAALGIGAALDASGASGSIAGYWFGLTGDNPWLALLMVYALTSLLTEIITNNAAAVLVFPFAEALAASLGVSFWPFVVAIMLAASASFATPIGYQTNLMVYGPGGYRFYDYLRIGLPLNILLGLTVVAMTPFFWPFALPA